MSVRISKTSFVGAACAILAIACHSRPTEQAQPGTAPSANRPAKIPEVGVADVKRWADEQSATVFDANDEDTRKAYGIVPGARLLTGATSYPLSVLPPAKDAKVVFYCGGTQCRGSDKAAARAASAGYSDVNVMRAGIRGWKAAGLPTTPTPQS